MTVGAIWAFEPSPDGSRVLVVGDGSGRHQPWLVPLDQRAPRMIEVEGSVQRCVWHPDGERFFALTDLDGRENNQIVLVNPVHPRRS